MEVVIKLSDDDYFSIKNGRLYTIGHDRLDTVVTEAVSDGIVLPEGHHDLVDVKTLNISLKDPIGSNQEDAVAVAYIEAPIVIPANKESET